MQGKLIAVAYTLRTYWNQFSLGGIWRQNRCISVPCPCQAVTSVLCLLFRPTTVYCSTQNVNSSEITFLALLFFQSCTIFFYCSVLSLGGNVNTRRMSKPNMWSIFHINNQWNILVKGNYYVNYQNYQNSMLLTSSDTKRTLRHLFLFTNSVQRELVSICTQSIRNCN